MGRGSTPAPPPDSRALPRSGPANGFGYAKGVGRPGCSPPLASP